jgi:phage FluMu protein Com
VAETTPKSRAFEIECPHCHKSFRGKLMAADSPRHAGFKCPHCKLFVAYERATEDERPH